jgi:DNA-directed RNA polymerase subunit M/transcription elongation factor TFIIS
MYTELNTMSQLAQQRIKVQGVILGACETYPEWKNLSAETQTTLVRRVERSCFEETLNKSISAGVDRLFTNPRFINIYSTESSRIIVNLDITSSVGSSYLISRLISGEINPYTVAKLSSDQLCPEAASAERAEINIRREQENNNDKKVSKMYVCKCGSTKTTFIEQQTRALDEASVRSIKCEVCKRVWRT